MADITQIMVRIRTSNRTGAGTDGHVFVAICGREFHLDKPGDDFEPNSTRDYILGGTDANLTEADRANNDPQNPQLDTNDLDRFPVWIRFEPIEPSPDWNLETVQVTVSSTTSPIMYNSILLTGRPDLWLGQRIGKFCFLRRV